MARNTLDIPYVEPHGKARRYRRVVPRDVRDTIGRKTWVKTFRARTPLAAIEHLAKRLAVEHDSLIARARNGEVLSPEIIAKAEAHAQEWLSGDRGDKNELYEALAFFTEMPNMNLETRALVNAIENGGRYVPEGLSLATTYERDKKHYGDGRDESPIAYAVNSFVASTGDKELTAIMRGDVVEWIATLEASGMAPSTIKRRLGALRAMVNRAFLDTDHNGRNPFEKHKIKDGAGGSSDRLPLNREMLAKIDSYLMSSRRLGHETVNLTRLMKCTGAGPAEIGGLVLSDVCLDEPIPFVWVRANAVRGIKTVARDRRIPLIGDLSTAEQKGARWRRKIGPLGVGGLSP